MAAQRRNRQATGYSSAMPLSSDASALLSQLRANGQPANPKSLKSTLGWDDRTFDQARLELIDDGLAKLVGSRLARSVTDEDLSIDAQRLISALPSDGSTVGNYSLRSRLDLGDEAYANAKQELRSKELIRVGAGYGGTVARSNPDAELTTRPTGARRHEKELYEPFCEWLTSSGIDQELAFFHVRDTSSPRGRKRSGGKWSRPDITAVQVFRYDWLPDIAVQVSTYEIKRAHDPEGLRSVYEAAAHGRWAHHASLVLEKEGDQEVVPSQAVLDEVRRFRLGLYTMSRGPAGTLDIKEVIKPPPTSDAEPEDLNELLEYFFQDNRELRQDFLRAIGR